MRIMSKNAAAGLAAVWLLSLCLPVLANDDGPAPKPTYLYKVSFVRAAPGRLLDLIALLKSRLPVIAASGDEAPLWWRHAEGDQWDLMVLFPMGSYASYYAGDRLSQRQKACVAAAQSPENFRKALELDSAWKEDLFVCGPPVEIVRRAFATSTFFHVEIFIALPGKLEDLYKEREMENAYQAGLGRPETMIFVRDQGAAWDLFTLGCYRDMSHWAESASIPRDKKEAAARRAGFASADAIGPYMRTLIDMHRDTIGGAIK